MSSDESDVSLPEEIISLAQNANDSLIPAKSKVLYDKMYNQYKIWKQKKKVKSENNSETVILAYFEELSKTRKPSSLWAQFSMIKATLNVYDNVKIGSYTRVIAFLNNKMKGYVPKKSAQFTTDEVKNFLNNAPDEKFLATKVVLIFGISGGLRKQEIANIKIQDTKSEEKVLYVNVPDTKTKTPRSFSVTGYFLDTVQKYQALRPSNPGTDRFFLRFQNGKCHSQVIGKNRIGKMPTEIAQFLNIPNPETYTGHCFSRTCATMFADAGGNITDLKRIGGWKSTSVAEGYISESKGYRRKMANEILSAVNPSASTSSSSVPEATHAKKVKFNDNTETETVINSNKNNSNENNQKSIVYHFHNCQVNFSKD